MYSISGIALDSTARGWAVDDRTRTLPELTSSLVQVSAAGRDGVLSVGQADVQAPAWALYVRTSIANREALIALVRSGSSVTVGAKSIGYTVAGVSLVDEVYAVGHCVVMFTLRLDGVWWRAGQVTSTAVSLGDASVSVTGLFAGLSAPVQDAVLRVKGAFTGLQVTDSSGAWFTYAPAVTTSQWFRFECATGRAFVTSTDVWTGGTEVSGAADFGGPRNVFEITPAWSADPSVRAGVLTVATASRSGATVQVRGRAAFLV